MLGRECTHLDQIEDVEPSAEGCDATEHPLVQSFQPGEDWIWCYVDEVVMEPAN